MTFNVSLCGAKGELTAAVDTPNGEEQEVFMQEMDRELYAIRFIPREQGVYYIKVKVCSPFILNYSFIFTVKICCCVSYKTEMREDISLLRNYTV